MKRLLLLALTACLLISTPSIAFDRAFTKERVEAIDRAILRANRAKKAGDIKLVCLEIATVKSIIGAFIDDLQEYYPSTDWFELRQSMLKKGASYNCSWTR
tara:strand:- start:79 stop:381 length:303 start_codon:yes stop_codon:yes gene_type:complete